MEFVALLTFALAVAAGDCQEVPDVLARAISRRMAFKTAYFRYDRKKIYSWGGAALINRFETRMSGEDMYWHNMGDEEGVLLKDYNTSQPIFGAGYACSPKHTVRCRRTGDEWFRHDGNVITTVVKIARTPDPFTLADPRSFGLSVKDLGDKSPAAHLEELQAKPARWTQRVVDGLLEVSMEGRDTSQDRGQMVWRIDPGKDDAIVEVRSFMISPDGQRTMLDTTKNEYVRAEDGWRLARTEYYVGTARSQTEVIHKAEFDRKEHPQVINADVLGLPAGARVADVRVSPGPGSHPVHRYLGGDCIVSKAEWHNIKHQYDLGELKKFEKAQYASGIGEFPKWWTTDEGTFGIEGIAHQPDLWETYVRRWILRRNHDTVVNLQPIASKGALSEAQIRAAWAILKDCRQRAEPIVQRMAQKAEDKPDTGDAVVASRQHSNKAAQATEERSGFPTSSAPAATAAKPNRHQRALGEIFESLKKRLDGLLRSEQEETAKAEPQPGLGGQ